MPLDTNVTEYLSGMMIRYSSPPKSILFSLSDEALQFVADEKRECRVAAIAELLTRESPIANKFKYEFCKAYLQNLSEYVNVWQKLDMQTFLTELQEYPKKTISDPQLLALAISGQLVNTTKNRSLSQDRQLFAQLKLLTLSQRSFPDAILGLCVVAPDLLEKDQTLFDELIRLAREDASWIKSIALQTLKNLAPIAQWDNSCLDIILDVINHRLYDTGEIPKIASEVLVEIWVKLTQTQKVNFLRKQIHGILAESIHVPGAKKALESIWGVLTRNEEHMIFREIVSSVNHGNSSGIHTFHLWADIFRQINTEIQYLLEKMLLHFLYRGTPKQRQSSAHALAKIYRHMNASRRKIIFVNLLYVLQNEDDLSVAVELCKAVEQMSRYISDATQVTFIFHKIFHFLRVKINGSTDESFLNLDNGGAFFIQCCTTLKSLWGKLNREQQGEFFNFLQKYVENNALEIQNVIIQLMASMWNDLWEELDEVQKNNFDILLRDVLYPAESIISQIPMNLVILLWHKFTPEKKENYFLILKETFERTTFYIELDVIKSLANFYLELNFSQRKIVFEALMRNLQCSDKAVQIASLESLLQLWGHLHYSQKEIMTCFFIPSNINHSENQTAACLVKLELLTHCKEQPLNMIQVSRIHDFLLRAQTLKNTNISVFALKILPKFFEKFKIVQQKECVQMLLDKLQKPIEAEMYEYSTGIIQKAAVLCIKEIWSILLNRQTHADGPLLEESLFEPLVRIVYNTTWPENPAELADALVTIAAHPDFAAENLQEVTKLLQEPEIGNVRDGYELMVFFQKFIDKIEIPELALSMKKEEMKYSR